MMVLWRGWRRVRSTLKAAFKLGTVLQPEVEFPSQQALWRHGLGNDLRFRLQVRFCGWSSQWDMTQWARAWRVPMASLPVRKRAAGQCGPCHGRAGHGRSCSLLVLLLPGGGVHRLRGAARAQRARPRRCAQRACACACQCACVWRVRATGSPQDTGSRVRGRIGRALPIKGGLRGNGRS
jgi:hypothetical protein